MLDEYVPRIERCVRMLGHAELWHRENARSNSIGNLLLHLEGNVRQWVLAGLGGIGDGRDRAAEFAASGAATAASATLLRRLRETVAESCDIVDRLSAGDMLATRTFQRKFAETGVGAVLHVLEHFSGHAGQIYAATKQMRAVDLAHYDL